MSPPAQICQSLDHSQVEPVAIIYTKGLDINDVGTPLNANRNGNCLYIPISTLLFGHGQYATQLLVITCIYMCTNMNKYTSHPDASEILMLSPTFQESCIQYATERAWLSAWSILVATGVISKNIKTIYPPVYGNCHLACKTLNTTYTPQHIPPSGLLTLYLDSHQLERPMLLHKDGSYTIYRAFFSHMSAKLEIAIDDVELRLNENIDHEFDSDDEKALTKTIEIRNDISNNKLSFMHKTFERQFTILFARLYWCQYIRKKKKKNIIHAIFGDDGVASADDTLQFAIASAKLKFKDLASNYPQCVSPKSKNLVFLK
ncbi:unnamed protein product [Mytilus coruscus]|uniref:Uncharacterized protein n=1 Tax=Mytilus coruscus TaxID=42192 RepID=A0A6J8AWD6_MYTCO|nr:unnamed protein product [Mytilus coruscus]